MTAECYEKGWSAHCMTILLG